MGIVQYILRQITQEIKDSRIRRIVLTKSLIVHKEIDHIAIAEAILKPMGILLGRESRPKAALPIGPNA